MYKFFQIIYKTFALRFKGSENTLEFALRNLRKNILQRLKMRETIDTV